MSAPVDRREDRMPGLGEKLEGDGNPSLSIGAPAVRDIAFIGASH